MLRCIELPDFSAIGYPMGHVKCLTARTCGIEPLRGVQGGAISESFAISFARYLGQPF